MPRSCGEHTGREAGEAGPGEGSAARAWAEQRVDAVVNTSPLAVKSASLCPHRAGFLPWECRFRAIQTPWAESNPFVPTAVLCGLSQAEAAACPCLAMGKSPPGSPGVGGGAGLGPWRRPGLPSGACALCAWKRPLPPRPEAICGSCVQGGAGPGRVPPSWEEAGSSAAALSEAAPGARAFLV